MTKEASELNLPDELRYAKDHEWARPDGDNVTVGLDDYAQDQLGDIVFVEMPEVGDKIEKGTVFATVESVKAVSDLFAPLTGSVKAINEALEDEPELVNEDPFGRGWMLKIDLKDPGQKEALLGPEAYAKHCEEGGAD